VIVLLNGAPRSGKSSIVAELQRTLDGTWMNLGVDVARHMTPPSAQPGIGLRPGEPAHPAAGLVPTLYAALWESVAAHERLGLDLAVDVGLHDRAAAADGARRLSGLPVLFVGVRCPVDVAIARRHAAGDERYSTDRAVVERWEEAVHGQWAYDLEVDSSLASPGECAEAIGARLAAGPAPTAFRRLATLPA
jgi:chloramphenicol 3-O phosphotransferase